jgi:hypothetical protein
MFAKGAIATANVTMQGTGRVTVAGLDWLCCVLCHNSMIECSIKEYAVTNNDIRLLLLLLLLLLLPFCCMLRCFDLQGC